MADNGSSTASTGIIAVLVIFVILVVGALFVFGSGGAPGEGLKIALHTLDRSRVRPSAPRPSASRRAPWTTPWAT